jgi:hypothetical protein
VEDTSLTGQATALNRAIGAIIAQLDIDALPAPERSIAESIKRQAADARLDVRDYEYADTRAEQLQRADIANKRLEEIQSAIVKASEYNMFSAIDVAQLSATIQRVIAQIS